MCSRVKVKSNTKIITDGVRGFMMTADLTLYAGDADVKVSLKTNHRLSQT